LDLNNQPKIEFLIIKNENESWSLPSVSDSFHLKSIITLFIFIINLDIPREDVCTRRLNQNENI
jgi:hypothetical protein